VILCLCKPPYPQVPGLFVVFWIDIYIYITWRWSLLTETCFNIPPLILIIKPLCCNWWIFFFIYLWYNHSGMNQLKINLFKPVCSATKFKNSEILHCAHIGFMCFIWNSKETTFALHNINISVIVTEVESVYQAVCTETLHKTDTFHLKRITSVLTGWYPRFYEWGS